MVQHLPKHDAAPALLPARAPRRKVFVRGLVLDASIGAYEHEKNYRQPVRIDLVADVVEPAEPASDRLEDVVCYNRLAQGIKAILAEGHIRLVETLAERIATLALSNPLVLSVVVKVEKPNAVREAEAAGVEIARAKPGADFIGD